jgi:hypothetical protein
MLIKAALKPDRKSASLEKPLLPAFLKRLIGRQVSIGGVDRHEPQQVRAYTASSLRNGRKSVRAADPEESIATL